MPVEIEKKVTKHGQIVYLVHLNPGGVQIFDTETAATAYAIAAEQFIRESNRIERKKHQVCLKKLRLAEGEPAMRRNAQMVTIEFWTAQNAKNPLGRLASRQTYSEAFDYADQENALRIKDGFGAIYRRIAGEWVQVK